ncbi:putative ABC transporter [Aspergillus avenaceus]|uniref:Putative ABC transporter n=1 Tax=Aspergillus avenaceus TaxID=36643 RepID=A0A5N6U6P6_ASPAV|nr:putative ABC transporter [Aspergillus avenaceus]
MSGERLRERILELWGLRRKPESNFTLPVTLLRLSRSAILSPILPRTFLIAFRYLQSVLIHATVRFISQQQTALNGPDTGPWLLISNSVYYHDLSRLQAMFRSALVGLIHHRTMHLQSGRPDSGAPVTLMSVDVEILSSSAEMLHETWGYMLEVIVGTALLASQVGWLCLIPLLLVMCCSWMSTYVAAHLQVRQRNWNVATQKRMSVTAAMLRSIKSMKMLGISAYVEQLITGLREREIRESKRLRWVMVAYNASANGLGMFAPVFTLVLYVLLGRSKHNGDLSAETAFTSIALLAMVTHPANMVMTIVPRAIASLSNSQRILEYLLQGTSQDHRWNINKAATGVPDDSDSEGEPAIIFDRVTIQHPHATQPVLRNINFTFDSGCIVMCSGPVACGKTTLVRAALGELSPTAGRIFTSTKRIGYCAQEPWLPTGTIKELICGGSAFDPAWYKKVLHACDLVKDLNTLGALDNTLIKFPGVNISGGQRQRVALARVLYARSDIVILDDTFSALDGQTEKTVVDNLLGPNGLFRQQSTTVIMITNSAQYFPLADQVLILLDSTVKMQGSWDEIHHNAQNIVKFSLHQDEEKDARLGTEVKTILPDRTGSMRDAANDLSRQSGDTELYRYYTKAMGTCNGLLMVFCTASYSFFVTFSQYWLKWWTEGSSRTTSFFMIGYTILALLAWISTNGIMWTTSIRISCRSGEALHKWLLTTILNAPFLYISSIDIGVTLNRFGEDIQLVDRQLPAAFQGFCTQAFKLLVQVTILFAVNKKLTVTLPFCMAIVYIVQKVYLRTSRQLRFLEIESKSALYSSFIETVDGISTIRAFNWQRRFEDAITERIDLSQRSSYLLCCLQRWLNLVLDLLIAGIAVGLVAVSVTFQGTKSAAAIGVSLNMIILANTTLLRLVQTFTNLEVSLGAIARLRSVITLTPQEEGSTHDQCRSLAHWPDSGAISIQDLEVAYSGKELAIQDINLRITPGQKVVICGRTGSGKSTLLLSLLRLLDHQRGSITIDYIDTLTVPTTYLRRQGFITVPQDPFILSEATLRFNINPDEALSDNILIHALGRTGLWEHLHEDSKSKHQDQDLPGESILDRPLSSLPPLSAGQLQLLSLSRALIHARAVAESEFHDAQEILSPGQRKPIVLLDEAMSAIDPDTEETMQRVIEEEWTQKGYTVVIVAHRAGAVLKNFRDNFDTVVWMNEGRIERMSHTCET